MYMHQRLNDVKSSRMQCSIDLYVMSIEVCISWVLNLIYVWNKADYSVNWFVILEYLLLNDVFAMLARDHAIAMIRWHVLYVSTTWPSDTISWHTSESTLTQMIVCCLTAPSHYLNKRLLITSEHLWHSREDNLTANDQDTFPVYGLENDQFKITARPARGQ